MTDPPTLDPEAERAAAELAKRLRRIVPASLLADPLAFSRQFITDMQAEHWHHVPPPAGVREQLGRGDPPNPEFLAAKAALTARPTEPEDTP